MSKTGDIWSGSANFEANGRFKFDRNGDWSINYGDNNGDMAADQNGDDIYIPGAGLWTITLNEKTLAYTMTKSDSSDLIIHYAEWESASTYYIHPWEGLWGDIAMNYEDYINGRHWWKLTISNAPSYFKFCFKNSSGNWDGTNRTYSNQANEIYVLPWNSTVYTTRP